MDKERSGSEYLHVDSLIFATAVQYTIYTQAQQAEAVERRKAERRLIFQPPVEDKKLSSVRNGKEAHTARSSAQQGSKAGGGGDDIDVSAIKKKVSKALKKV